MTAKKPLYIHAPTQIAELPSLNEPGLEPVCVYARKALLIAQRSLQRLTNSLPAIEGFPERLLQLVYLDSTEAAFSEIYADYSFRQQRAPFALKLKNWWDLAGVNALANRQFPTGHGSHATPSEIAVTQWAYPEAIKTAAYSPQIAPTGPIREALDFRARYADGRMGSDPAQATPEKGGELVNMAANALIEDLAAFAAEQAPA
jgi:hypothetical protein